MRFEFDGRPIHESTRTTGKTVAQSAEKAPKVWKGARSTLRSVFYAKS
jgi:hypothetical protein